MADIRIAWWNLENLFDHENATRGLELATALGSELKGWTVAIRNRKLDQLATIINGMFNGEGPDLLGVCEVEDETVLGLLNRRLTVPGRNYEVVAHNSPDARGIDVSFIVDRNLLEPTDAGHQVVIKRRATRDIFWIELTEIVTGNVFVAVGNHWPSRTAGRYESEPYRMLTGETVSYTLSRLFDAFAVGNRLPIIVMGDFNDEPFDRSMQEYLLGSRDSRRVSGATTPRVLNLMWPLMHVQNPGTYRFGSDWNMLDQFLVTRGMIPSSSPVRVLADSVQILRPTQMLGSGGKPLRYGRPSNGSLDQDGFSDHFPIAVVVRSA